MKDLYIGRFSEFPITGVTGTLFDATDKQDLRFEISLATAESWENEGYPLVVVDSSPIGDRGDNAERVKAAYIQRGAIVLRARLGGIATQRQQGVQHVLLNGGGNTLTHEPEKPDIAKFARSVASILEANDVVIIGRTKESKISMPPVQRRTEELAGWIIEQTLSLPPDSLAGPRGYSKQGAKHLLEYPSAKKGMNNWIYMYTTALEAIKSGQGVVGMQAELIYPEAMVAQETGNDAFDRKRYEQFVMQLKYLLQLPDVRPEALVVANIVLDQIEGLLYDPTNVEYEAMIGEIEVVLAKFGYKKP